MAEPKHNRMARRLEMRAIDELEPYEGNARTHSSQQIDQIAASIAEMGFNNPVLIDSKCRVVAGHGRLEAAKTLGLDQVPVVVLDHLSDRERRAYILADNRIAENAGWDQGQLAEELTWLAADGMELDALGFTDAELADLIDEQVVHVSAHERLTGTSGESSGAPGENTSKPDPVESESVSRAGDVWLLDGSRIVCGKKPGFAVDEAVRRWQEISGQKATLSESGITFDQVVLERSWENGVF